MNASPDGSALLQQLTARTDAAVQARDRARAARHLLDWIACSAAASGQPEARQFHASLGLTGARVPAGLDPAIPEAVAVLADGALGSLLEMDDVHRRAVLHPGPVVIPAALATARSCNASIEQLLDGLVRGYDIMIRLGKALGLDHYRFWHPTSTCGAFGAAGAAASIRGLDPAATVWALANAGSRTGGLWQMRHEPVPTKAVHTALAAQSGWLAAALAAQGFAGPTRLLEGSQGLFAAMAPSADPGPVRAEVDGWQIHAVSFKPWPACRHAHAAMDALLALPNLPSPGEIDRIEVATYRAALDFCDCVHPTTAGQARFSLQHALASILVHGRPRLRHYDPEYLDESEVSALRRRFVLSVDARAQQAFPAHFGASVTLLLRDGQQLQARVDDAWGDPERPLSDADLAGKATDVLGHAGWSEARIAELVDALLTLSDHPRQPAAAALGFLLT